MALSSRGDGCSNQETPNSDIDETRDPLDGNDSTPKKKKLFPSLMDRNDYQYHEMFEQFDTTWPNTFCWMPSFRNLTLQDRLKIHKTDRQHAEYDVLEDPYTLELDDPSDMTIYAEDLSPKIMNTLGSVFQIFPGMFEQHLVNSAFAGRRLPYEDFNQTSISSPKDYASLRWFSIASLSQMLLGSPKYQRQSKIWQILAERKETRQVKIPSDRHGSRSVSLSVNENIYRQQKDLSTRGRNQFACEERATLTVKTHGTSRRLILLLDPVPTATLWKSSDQYKPVALGRRHILEKRAAPRCPHPTDVYDWNNLPSEMGSLLSTSAQSTYRDMQRWSRLFKQQGKAARTVDALFEVVRIDTLSVISLLDTIGREVQETLSDESKEIWLQHDVQQWKSIFLWAHFEVPEVSKSLKEMATYVEEQGLSPQTTPNDRNAESRSTSFGDKAQVLIGRLDEAQARIRMTLEAVNSAMALRNSEKGIAEAENVKRLTELAFIFIPLTFAAAIFSIQVQEFQQRPPQMVAFVITAICLLCAVYCFRLAQYLGTKHHWGALLRRGWSRVGMRMSEFLESWCGEDDGCCDNDCCADGCCDCGGYDDADHEYYFGSLHDLDPGIELHSLARSVAQEGVVCEQPRMMSGAPSLSDAISTVSKTSRSQVRARDIRNAENSGDHSHAVNVV